MKTYEQEVWKDIPGYENYYQVSDHGRVRSLDRIIKHKQCGYQYKKGMLLKAGQNVQGYPQVMLAKNKKETACVHALVMLAFVGPTPKGLIVRHYDDVKTNNDLSNLLFGTPKDNKEDAVRNGLAARGEKCNSKLTADAVATIRWMHKISSLTQKEIGCLFDVADSTINRLLLGKNWKHI